MASVLKALLYARVSTNDQHPESQLEELRLYCRARKWVLVEEIVDHGFSGGNDQRPGLKRLITLARSRKVDVVLTVKLDRLARSLRHLVTLLDEFSSLGVQFVSIHDQIDFTSASGRLMLHIIGAFAEFERSLIRERTIAGLAHARSRGRRLGRPKTTDVEAIVKLRAQGLSHKDIVKQLNVSSGSVWRALKGTPKSCTKHESKSPSKSKVQDDEN